MKIMIQTGLGANYYIRKSICDALQYSGHNVYFWDDSGKSPFDAFAEFEPELFLGSTWQLNRAQIKNLAKRPHIKVGLFADIWGEIQQGLNLNQYPVGITTDTQKSLVEELLKVTTNCKFVISQHNERSLKSTHNGWITLGLEPISVPCCANVLEYAPTQQDPKYNADIVYCGNYWKYKADSSIDRYLMPLLFPNTEWRIKIFGDGGWNVPSYLGKISPYELSKFYTNAKLVPSFAERHSVELYSDIPQRFYQVSAAGGFQLAENVIGLDDIFAADEIVSFDNQKDFFDKCVHYLNRPHETILYRNQAFRAVISSHTCFHRAITIMRNFKEDCLSLMERIDQLNQKYFGETNGQQSQ